MFRNPPQKMVPFVRYVEEHGTDWHAANDNIVRRMRLSGWITKATHT
jgi:hypothetical protein